MLQTDLVNKLTNDKFYKEIELQRLASEPNMNYETKINEMLSIIELISIIDSKLALIEKYFGNRPEKELTTPEANLPQGQTHAE